MPPIYKFNFPVALRVHSYLSPRGKRAERNGPGVIRVAAGAGAYLFIPACKCRERMSQEYRRAVGHKYLPRSKSQIKSANKSAGGFLLPHRVPSPNRAHAVTIHFHEYRASRRSFLPEDETRIGASGRERRTRDAGNAFGITPVSGSRKTKRARSLRSDARKRKREGGKGLETRFCGDARATTLSKASLSSCRGIPRDRRRMIVARIVRLLFVVDARAAGIRYIPVWNSSQEPRQMTSGTVRVSLENLFVKHASEYRR